ncbi:MAG: ABC transporter permease [Bacillota bacterium]
MANKLRSALTILGVTIGIAAVIGIVAIADGTQRLLTGEIESLGSYLLAVAVKGRGPDRAITHSELNEIIRDIPGIAGISPIIEFAGKAKYGAHHFDCTVLGVNDQYSTVRDIKVTSGRFLSQIDVATRQKVALLGPEVVGELFSLSDDPLGKEIKLNGQTFQVAGVLAARGGGLTGSEDNQVLIPVTAAESLLGRRGFNVFFIKGQDNDSVRQIFASIQDRLYRRFRDENAYEIFDQTQLLEMVQTASRSLTLMLAGIAFISLLVGGIGIMNIMLVSVVERTREIGLRKALGATNKDILRQFLLESVVLSMIGGLTGIITGTLLGKGIGALIKITTVFPWKGAGIATGLAIAVGVCFGIFPANRAANLEPIEALRVE